MARRRTRSGGKAVARRRARHERLWQLLLFGAVTVTLGVITIESWRPATTSQNAAKPMTMAEARASNAAIPIEHGRRRRAATYRLRTDPGASRQAVECLATAALFEAGNDHRGQEAVMQVILNRVRAPGFPKTICGVVYQGSSRATGCQFSFTCDGSMQRRPVRFGWAAARRRARQALAGHVDGAVGGATHYHTDWIVPYWRDSMIKVARVRTHLFYVRPRG